MKNFISQKMNLIFQDFQNEILRRRKLCVLKGVRFNGPNIPDYSLAIVQQAYLLRYFPAYLVEYYEIYKKLFEFNFLQPPFTIFSIGCGCAIDFYGLYFAARERKLNLSKEVS